MMTLYLLWPLVVISVVETRLMDLESEHPRHILLVWLRRYHVLQKKVSTQLLDLQNFSSNLPGASSSTNGET